MAHTPRPVEQVRLAATATLDPTRKAEFGQFLTPAPIASFMASLFERWPENTRLLDAGAGVGSLSDAVVVAFSAKAPPKSRLTIDAYELEPLMLPLLSAHLATLKSVLESSGHNAEINVHARDFIKEGSYAASFSHAAFTHAILNPPYKKIGAKSEQRLLLRKLGIETVNLYAAFLGLAIALTRPSGEIVAIVPRSFCNGAYFKRFRLWLLDHVSIRQIHVFESRTEAFRDDRVLQENVIIHLVRDSDQQEVTISSSTDPTFSDYASIQVPFVEIVRPSDEEKYIRIPSVTLDQSARLFTRSLIELGLDVSTGPVVDFRVRESWLSEPEPGAVPLLYAHHFRGREFKWPRCHKKPNALVLNEQTRRWLLPRGWYVVTKRFSAKEERRRVVAFVVDPGNFDADYLGFENHLNVIHGGKKGIARELSNGLALFLNSTIFDQHFRSFSGHTQVNATDLRTMKYPDAAILRTFGRWAQEQKYLEQEAIDAYLNRFLDSAA